MPVRTDRPDPETQRDAQAIVAARRHGFVLAGSTHDDRELFFRRYVGDFVDLMTLCSERDTASGALRYERRGFPWDRDQWPDHLRYVRGSIVDVVRQVLEWPTDGRP